MKLLMCCTLVPAKYEVENREISNAANRFLTNLCGALEKQHSVKVLSYVGVNFESDSRKELEVQNSDKMQYFFKNNGLIKSVFKMTWMTWKELKKHDYVITYNVVYAWMLTSIITRIRNKKSVLILADYSPIESYTNIKQKIYARIQEFFIGKYDYVIGLSEKTKKYLNSNQKFMCMEGGISEAFYDFFNRYTPPNFEKIIIMYSGILEKVTGVDMLIDSFLKIKESNVYLIITGDGSLAPWVFEKMKEHSNIQYLGCIPYEQYMKKLQEADILINPRNMNLPENANNFPSKIMEYLATGKMIISTKFPGWERYKNVVCFSDSDRDSILHAIQEKVVCVQKWKKENYCENREFAKQFIWTSQVEVIEKFITH